MPFLRVDLGGGSRLQEKLNYLCATSLQAGRNVHTNTGKTMKM